MKQHDFVSLHQQFSVVFDFSPDSIFLAVEDHVFKLTKRSIAIPRPDWKALLSRGQQLLDNHLARIPITMNQVGTHKKRGE